MTREDRAYGFLDRFPKLDKIRKISRIGRVSINQDRNSKARRKIYRREVDQLPKDIERRSLELVNYAKNYKRSQYKLGQLFNEDPAKDPTADTSLNMEYNREVDTSLELSYKMTVLRSRLPSTEIMRSKNPSAYRNYLEYRRIMKNYRMGE